MDLKSPKMLVVMGVALAAAAVAYAAGLPPALLLIFAVCPLMMLFMMVAMGGMGRTRDGTNAQHDLTHDENTKHEV